jgi:hypothetical protein
VTDLRIVSSGATPEEIAAVTAVLHRALDELAAEAAPQSAATVSAWQRSQRAVRSPLSPGTGAWRSFSG